MVTKNPSVRWRLAALGFVLIGLVAAFLRFWKLAWGLSDSLFVPDEMIWGWRASHFVPLTWKSFLAVNLDRVPYPAFYGYLVGLVTALAHALGLTREPPAFFFDIILLSRAVSAFFGILTVCVVGFIGARLCSLGVGLAAAALMAVVPLEVVQGYYASVDVLQTTLMVASLFFGYRLALTGATSPAVLAGLFAGLACATKFPGVFAFAPIAWALVERAREDRRLLDAVVLGLAVLAISSITFAVACPPCLLRALPMLETIREARLSMWNAPNNTLASSLGWYARPYLYELVASLPFSLGWPLYTASLAGLWGAVRRRDLLDRILLAALGPYFLLIGVSHITFPRYLLPLFPPLMLLVSRLLPEPPRRGSAGVAALGVVWLYTATLTFSQVANISHERQ